MIVGVAEIIVAIRVAVPPGIEPEQALKMMSNNGLTMPVGLLTLVRQVHAEIVAAGQSSTVPALENAGNVKLL